jgi:hypothetical protein
MHNPFKKDLTEADVANVQQILNEFDIVKVDRPAPSSTMRLSQIMHDDAAGVGRRQSDLQQLAGAMDDMASSGTDPTNELVKTIIYTFGVRLYELALTRVIPVDAINTACTYFEFAVKLDPQYYQAYNRLGDTWIWIPDEQDIITTIGCYKASLNVHGQGRSSTAMFVGGGDERFKGNNYFKIGMCLARLKRVDDAILFISYAQRFIDDDDDMYSELGFENWSQVYERIQTER